MEDSLYSVLYAIRSSPSCYCMALEPARQLDHETKRMMMSMQKCCTIKLHDRVERFCR